MSGKPSQLLQIARHVDKITNRLLASERQVADLKNRLVLLEGGADAKAALAQAGAAR